MAERREAELNGQLPERGWPDLEPDPQAMERVVAQMIAGVTAAPETTLTAEPVDSGNDVSRFRLLMLLFGAVVTGGYLCWPWASVWLEENPLWGVMLAIFGIISLLTPLLLPLLIESDSAGSSESRGGVTSC